MGIGDALFFLLSFCFGRLPKSQSVGAPCFFFLEIWWGVQSPCHRRDRARGAREVAASRNSDATRLSVKEYMCPCLCQVASRLPCDPTTGVAALLVASSPRIPLPKPAHFIFFGLCSQVRIHRAIGINDAGYKYWALSFLELKSKMRLDFLSRDSFTDACGESHRDSRVS